MSRIVDASNEAYEVAIWTESHEPFFVVRFEKSDNTDGFDWVKLNSNGKIISHHNIGTAHATFFADEATSEYIKKNDANSNRIHEILAGDFNIYSIYQGNTTLYTSQQWLHFPALNTDIDFRLKVTGHHHSSYITFNLPTGIQMAYNTENDTYINVTSYDPIPIKNNLKLKIKATSAIGESSIVVQDKNKRNIGELGVLAYDETTINIRLWSLVSNPNGRKNAERIGEEGNKLMLQDKKDPETQRFIQQELNELKAAFKRIYLPLNIRFNISVSNKHLTYDPKDVQSFNTDRRIIFHNDTIVKYDSAGEFLEEIVRLNNADFDDGFIHIMIAECNCETNRSSIKGIGQIGRNCTIMFNNDRTNFDVYTHEVGHNLNLCHTFQKDNDPAFGSSLFYLSQNQKYLYWAKHDAVYDITDMGQKLPEDSETFLTEAEQNEYEELRQINIIQLKNVNGEILTEDEEKIMKANETNSGERLEKRRRIFEKYYDESGMSVEKVNNLIKERQGIYRDIDKILYTEAITQNVMDYSGIYNYFFKWQWKIIRNRINNL